MVAKQEADNSEDISYVAKLNRAADQLQATVAPMVHNAKDVALDPAGQQAVSKWRQANNAVSSNPEEENDFFIVCIQLFSAGKRCWRSS